jgi:hypothetical protein
MKHLLRCWALLAVLFSAPLLSQAQAKTIRLFMIGNSFSGNASRYLPQITQSAGDEIIIGRAEIGGAPMQKHWDAIVANDANPEDPKGKPYNGKSLRELLSAKTWDIVSIQQASINSSNIDTYRPYAQKLRDFIKTVQPQAEVVMHQTWAYRVDSKDFGQRAGGGSTQSQQEMWEKSRAAYHTIAGELGLRLIPVGDAFQRVNTDPKWGFKKDEKFDYAHPVASNLPDQTHSLNNGYSWSKAGAFVFDSHHANSAGCYLAGLVWYGFLFGNSPEKVTFAPASVSPDFAAYLRQTAGETLAEGK